jgi:molybdate transport system ATP-binding protein
LVLDRGRVVAQGRPSAVLSDPRRVLDPLAGVEDVLNGTILEGGDGVTRVALKGGLELRLPASGMEVGEHVLIGLRAKDVLVSTERLQGISARNVLAAQVVDMERYAEDVLIACELQSEGQSAGELVHVELTINAAKELKLEPGTNVHLVIKAHACRVLSAFVDGA